jgi:hypothetical protein
MDADLCTDGGGGKHQAHLAPPVVQLGLQVRNKVTVRCGLSELSVTRARHGAPVRVLILRGAFLALCRAKNRVPVPDQKPLTCA